MAGASYPEVLAALYALEAAKGMDFKLERVALALQYLGNPHRQFAAIHIAGTNGKGSVAAMLHAMFAAGGYRVGLYTSPHLVSFTERIRVGLESIREEEVVELAAEIHHAAAARNIELTFFEFVTVMSFLHFARRQVDLAVVEVGLGGRLDATNVLQPEVAVITTIGLDHQEFLGDTLAAIAREKAGIIKPTRPVVVGSVTPDVGAVLAGVAAHRAAPLFAAGRNYSMTCVPSPTFSGFGRELCDLTLRLQGQHQYENSATALATALCMQERFPLTETAMRRGLADVRWPGRLDVVHHDPLVVLDGAHNADGVRALVRALPALVGRHQLHVVFGVMRDKHWQPMVDLLGPLAASATLTTAAGTRSEQPALLARAFMPHCRVHVVPDPADAVHALLESVPSGSAILVTGSLFLVGAVYPYFMGQRGQSSLFSIDSRPPCVALPRLP